MLASSLDPALKDYSSLSYPLHRAIEALTSGMGSVRSSFSRHFRFSNPFAREAQVVLIGACVVLLLRMVLCAYPRQGSLIERGASGSLFACCL